MKKKSILYTVPALAAIASVSAGAGDCTTWSCWSTTRSWVSGETSKTQWRKANLSWGNLQDSCSGECKGETVVVSYNCGWEEGCCYFVYVNGSAAFCDSCYHGSGGACYGTKYRPAVWTWGSWTDSQQTAGSGQKVETRTLYSYPLNYTIKFNANGGSGSMSNITGSYGGSTTLPGNAFTRTGYTFKGWALSSGGSVAISNGGAATASNTGASPNGTVTLYAVWQINQYTITFKNAGSYTKNYNQTVTAPAGPAKKGYTFQYWKRTS